MPDKLPVLDNRILKDIMKDLYDMTKVHIPEWNPPPEGDAGAMLHRIYARLLEITLERLNKVPEKNLIAFLSTMGVNLLPASPAVVPLTFELMPGTEYALIPEGTMAGTEQVIFETEEDITAISSKIIKAFTINPFWESYSDITGIFGRGDSFGFSPFEGKHLLSYAMLFGHAMLLDYNKAKVEIKFKWKSQEISRQEFTKILERFKWRFIREENTVDLKVKASDITASDGIKKAGVVFENTAPPEMTAVKGPGICGSMENRWISMTMNTAHMDKRLLNDLMFTSVELVVSSQRIPPDTAFFNTAPVDITKDFYPFGEAPKTGDVFYLSCKEAFSKSQKNANCTIDLDFEIEASAGKIKWEYCSSSGWKELVPLSDSGQDFTGQRTVTFSTPSDIKKIRVPVEGMANYYYYVRASIADKELFPAPAFECISVQVKDPAANSSNNYLPLVFTSDSPVDDIVSGDFKLNGSLEYVDKSCAFPFGTDAKIGKTAYFALLEETKGGWKLEFSFSPKPKSEILWEYCKGKGMWEPLNVSDGTAVFTKKGMVNFKLPCDIQQEEICGQSNYWVRARIIRGNFGKPAEYIPVKSDDPSRGYRIATDSGKYIPPFIKSIRINYTSTVFPSVLSQSGFIYSDRTELNSNETFYTPADSVKNVKPYKYADARPSLYLGFDRFIQGQPVTIYASARPTCFSNSAENESITSDRTDENNRIGWEYFNGKEWKTLSVTDTTDNMKRSGIVKFLMPYDASPFSKFHAEEELYWIRAVSALDNPLDAQVLTGIYLNTVPALHGITKQEETLGSSNGQPGQIMRLTSVPVLEGIQVFVREYEPPSDNELCEIEQEEGRQSVILKVNPVTKEAETWVRWHEVSNFLMSNPKSRHYTFDYTKGTITFGDGKRGLIPPYGSNNITASYRTGGGTAGNIKKGSAIKVKSSIPGVSGVINPMDAEGGSEPETLDMARVRGPQVLKSRNYAVTSGDIEWLARQAAGTRIARTKCLTNINRQLCFEPGCVTLIAVPQVSDDKPLPGPGLIRRIEDYLKDRLSANMKTWLNVIGPGYIKVAVYLEVAPVDIDDAQTVKNRVITALKSFFNPLRGGPDCSGWEFGRDVYLSEICRVIESIEGVDHVNLDTMDIRPNIAQKYIEIGDDFDFINFIGMEIHKGTPVAVNIPDTGCPRKLAVTAQSVFITSDLKGLYVKGFKEGDKITRILDIEVQEISVESKTIWIKPVTDMVGFPYGSSVTSADGTKRARLAQGILPESVTNTVLIEGENTSFFSDLKPGSILTLFYPFPMTVTDVSMNKETLVLGIEPYSSILDFPAGSVFSTMDNSVRLPLKQAVDANKNTGCIILENFLEGETMAVLSKYKQCEKIDFTVKGVHPVNDTVYLEENYLVYSGEHTVNIVDKAARGRSDV
ncbi:MAG: putative baseplate assembly protein [Clostridia bacterium]|nr:putative baseplate assembly protein [Clostridia bacterium]